MKVGREGVGRGWRDAEEAESFVKGGPVCLVPHWAGWDGGQGVGHEGDDYGNVVRSREGECVVIPALRG